MPQKLWIIPIMQIFDNETVKGSGINITCPNSSNSNCVIAEGPVNPEQPLKWGLLSLLLVIVCTALGNLLVCLAVCWDRRLQNMTNYFLMSLAIADLLVSVLVMPFGMVVEIFGYFPLEAEFCAFWVTMDVLMCTASIWHMCTMSMDRFFTLKYPMQYGRNKTRMMVALKILFVWAVSIAISSPICIYGFVDTSIVLNDGLCVPTLQEFVIYGSIFAFYIPLLIMILTYILTIRLLWQNQNMMKTIVRSDLRPRRLHRSTNRWHEVATLVSPPSSDSRKASIGDSHTEVSSLARSPMIELRSITPSRCRLVDPQTILSGSPLDTQTVLSPSSTGNNAHEGSDFVQTTEDEILEDEKIPEDNIKNSNITKPDDITCDSNENPVECLPTTLACIPIVTEPPSDVSDNETDDRDKKKRSSSNLEYGSMVILNNPHQSFEALSQPSSPSTLPRHFRSSMEGSSGYASFHSSLKIPRTTQHLQASVSCSNFSRETGSQMDLHTGTRLHGGNLNRDYKSVEWCMHFYEIQKEMDDCLKDGKRQRKFENQFKKDKEMKTEPLPDQTQKCHKTEKNSNDKNDTEKDKMTQSESKSEEKAIFSDSGDSLDDLDSSSENNSDLMTIKLYPKSARMYKLDVPKAHSSSASSPLLTPNKHIPNGAAEHLKIFCSDSSKADAKYLMHRRTSSIRQFLKRLKATGNKQGLGFKHFISNKTTTNERKASKVLGIIFAVFVFLWTPFFTVNLLSATCDSCMKNVTPEMMSIFLWMGYIASLANPIIYTMFNTAFRRAFTRILSCYRCRHGTISFHRTRLPPSYAATVHSGERRQTVTLLFNSNEARAHSDLGSNSR